MRSFSLQSSWLILMIGLMTSYPAMGDETQAADVPAVNDDQATEKELKWHKSIEAAIEEARRRKTPILVRVGAVWCVYCRKLDKEIALPDVQKELAGWTLAELDADEDQDEVSRLSVGPIPALRVLNANGRAVRSHDGYLPAAELIRWLRGQDEEPPDEIHQDVTAVPELDESTLPQLVRLLAHRDANIRESVSRRLKTNRKLAAAEVAKIFAGGKLAAKLAALELLTDWKAPVKGLDPWQPQSITADRLNDLESWSASLESDNVESSVPVEPLTAEELAEARIEIDKIILADPTEMDAIGARLARYGDRLLPSIHEVRQRADSDQARERLDWLRFRVVASDALMLKWPGGLTRLAAIDARLRHSAAGELPAVVTHGDETLLIELFSHPDPLVREFSLKALHEVGGQRSSSELTRLLADPEPNVRAAVLKQLAEKPSAKIVPQIAEYISHETDPDLIVHAVRLLREIKKEESLKCLITLFDHEVWQVRAEAVEAVGASIGQEGRYGATTLDASVVADAWTAVLELLDDSDGFVVGQAVNALKDSDLPIAALPLSKAAERQPELAGIVADAIIGGEKIQSKGVPLLRGWLKHPDENLRAAALPRLQSLNGSKELIPALSDASEKVRVAAAQRLLEMCDSNRPVLDPGTESSEPETGIEIEVEPSKPESVIERAARALGSLFQPGIDEAPRKEKPKPRKDPNDLKSDAEDEAHPSEKWLAEFRAGKGRPAWMKDAIEPLNVMFQSKSAPERIASGQALIALGNDDETLKVLLQMAAEHQPFVVQVSQSLRWLPWPSRIETFATLRHMVQDPEQLTEICDQLVVMRDLRATDVLWEILADRMVNAALASSVFENWVQIHGINMQYGYINSNERKKPIAFRPDSVKTIAQTSEFEWQRRVALALLLEFDKPAAEEAAGAMIDDKNLPASLRSDAFVTILRSEEVADAKKRAVEAVKRRDPSFVKSAFVFLNLGPEKLDSFADGQFHLPYTSHMMNDGQTKKALPDELKIEDVEPFLTEPDDELAAHAAYLAALLGRTRGIERLIAFYRKKGVQNYESQSWRKLTYEAIAATDDPRLVPVLEEIYKSMREHDSYHLKDLYWTIRTMRGPEILKLRKLMRDEVGMSQLR